MSEEKTKEALDALERILAYTNGLGDGEAYTIRAALTAQDVNEELLKVLNDINSAAKTSGSIIGFAAKVFKLLNKIRQAIANAEAQKVGTENEDD